MAWVMHAQNFHSFTVIWSSHRLVPITTVDLDQHLVQTINTSIITVDVYELCMYIYSCNAVIGCTYIQLLSLQL